MTLQILRFCIVGAAAFACHLLLVVALVTADMLSPLVANFPAFGIAFLISYWGHRNWTYRAGTQRHITGLLRFGLVAVIGFIVNESSYAILLNWMQLQFIAGLIISLLLAAVSTYVLSRYWAFSYVIDR